MINTKEELAEQLCKEQSEIDEAFYEFLEFYRKAMLAEFDEKQLVKDAEKLFIQKYIMDINAVKSSNSTSINIAVFGVTKLKDSVDFERKECIKAYNANHNQAIAHRKVNEYTQYPDAIIKQTWDTTEKKIVGIEVEEVPVNAISVGDNVFVAPREWKVEKWKRPNAKLGEEFPLNSFQRYVYGIIGVKEKGEWDLRMGKVLLKGDNATAKTLPIPGKFYSVLAQNYSIGLDEFSFIGSQKLTNWGKEIDWNPYEEGNFFEQVLKEDFMERYVKTLGGFKDIAEMKFAGEYTGNRTTIDNACIFCEAQLMSITLYPEGSGKYNRVVINDDSVEYNKIEDTQIITGWLSEPAAIGLDTGVYSRAIICGYPKMNKANGNRPKQLTVDVYGILPIERYRSRFNKSDYIKVNNLNEIDD
jgi:hypothetical protein